MYEIAEKIKNRHSHYQYTFMKMPSCAAEIPHVHLVRQIERGQLFYKQFVFRHNQCAPPTCFVHRFLNVLSNGYATFR